MKELAEKIIKLLEEKRVQEIREAIDDLYPPEFAEVADHLSIEQTIEIFKLFRDNERLAELLSELSPNLQVKILTGLDKEKASSILKEMGTDDVANLLREVTPQESRELLNLIPEEEAEDIKELLKYEENTAGSIMTKEFIALPQNITVEEAINKLRELSPKAEMIYYVYIVDKIGRLVGVVSLRDLIVANPQVKIREIMKEDVISVLDTEDQEIVARLISDYNFLALPVIDKKGVLLGMITIDDVIDVLEEEFTEDILKMAGSLGTHEDKLLKVNSLARAKARIPWLFVCLLGDLISASIMKYHSAILEAIITMSFFIPIILDMGGNVGAQSSTITVRALATGQIEADELWKNTWAEVKVGCIIGLVVGVAMSFITLLWMNNYLLGLLTGVSLGTTMIAATTIGALLPLIFTEIEIDPAIAAGPFITTAIDVSGLLIYFGLGTFLFKHFGM